MRSEVTVAIPFQNHEAWLEKTLQSVVEQTMPPAEIILSNDRSTDGSLRRVEDFQKRSPVPVRVVHVPPPGGGGRARATLLNACRTPWIVFLDADDLIAPEKLEYEFDLAQRHPEVAVVAGATRFVGEDDEELPRPVRATPPAGRWPPEKVFLRHLFDTDMIVSPGASMIRADRLRPHLENVPELEGIQDQTLWGFPALEHPFYFHTRPLFCYRVRRRSHSSTISPNVVLRSFLTYYLLLADRIVALGPRAPKSAREALRAAYLDRLLQLVLREAGPFTWRLRFLHHFLEVRHPLLEEVGWGERLSLIAGSRWNNDRVGAMRRRWLARERNLDPRAAES